MPVYQFDGLKVEVPQDMLSPALAEVLESGGYEALERRAVRAQLKPGDRFLDLGAGVGLTSIVAAQIVGGENVIAVEPNPGLLEVLDKNFDRNAITGVSVEDVAVLPARERGNLSLYIGSGFWSASLVGSGETEVPVRGIGLWDLIDLHTPDVILCDLEGFETALLTEPLPEPPRLVIVELHPRKYTAHAIRAIFDGMSASGMAYSPQGSRGGVVVFEKIED